MVKKLKKVCDFFFYDAITNNRLRKDTSRYSTLFLYLFISTSPRFFPRRGYCDLFFFILKKSSDLISEREPKKKKSTSRQKNASRFPLPPRPLRSTRYPQPRTEWPILRARRRHARLNPASRPHPHPRKSLGPRTLHRGRQRLRAYHGFRLDAKSNLQHNPRNRRYIKLLDASLYFYNVARGVLFAFPRNPIIGSIINLERAIMLRIPNSASFVKDSG